MDKRSKFRDLVRYRAGALCLIGILAATYMHSAAFMSQFFYQSILLGGIAAFAIDAGVVSMSIFKDELLKTGELAWMVRVVTVMVLFASGVANMAEGFESAYGITLTTQNLLAMDALTWIQWLAGTIIFPITAYVMCDTIGTRNLLTFKQEQNRRQQAVVIHEDPARELPAERRAGSSRKPNRTDSTKERRKERVRELIFANHTDMSTLMAETGVNSSTVRRYIDELKREGRLPGEGNLRLANQVRRSNKEDRQTAVYEYVRDHGGSPSLREIAAAVGAGSADTIRGDLADMGLLGYYRDSAGQIRQEAA